MHSSFTILPEAVRSSDAVTKQAILEELADVFADAYGLDGGQALAGMEARERLGSTGFGRGVAIPHARLPDMQVSATAFLRLNDPIDFDAADGAPVGLVFGLISPERAGAAHLHALAAISRMMRDERQNEILSAAKQESELYGLLSNVLDRHAA